MFMFPQLCFTVNFLWTKHLVKNSQAQHFIYSPCEERGGTVFPSSARAWKLEVKAFTQHHAAKRCIQAQAC